MRLRHLAAAAAVVALAGCGAQPLEPDTVAVIPPQNAGMEALLVGGLDVTDECVTVLTPDGAVTPIFPRTLVAWRGDSLEIDGETRIDGAPVWLTGGFVQDVPSGAHIPSGCPTDQLFLVAG